MFLLRWLYGLLARIYRFFFRKKLQKKEISFDEWIDLLRQVSLEGFGGEAFKRISEGFPPGARSFSETDGNQYLAKEMSKYANARLSGILAVFQDDVREALSQGDESRLERAFRVLRQDLGDMMFFERLEEFPNDIAVQLAENIEEAVIDWQAQYRAVLRENFEVSPAGSLGEELLWLFTINPPAEMLRPMEESTKNYA